MPTKFKCLSFLDTDQLCIVEIKLPDIHFEFGQKERYKWLLINKENLTIKEMEFKSMDSAHEIEERFFDLGYLKFDYQKGVYISKEPALQYPLENTSCETVPDTIIGAITNFLN